MVGADLFEWKKTIYLLTVDYYSRFIEVVKLSALTSSDIIRHLKTIFARYGISEELRSDNSPQFSANEFAHFAKEYDFRHTTSSPKYPQANGEPERAVQTVKMIYTKSEDPFLGLLAYRSTPLENGYSPAELLMGRKLRSNVPTILDQLTPQLPSTA